MYVGDILYNIYGVALCNKAEMRKGNRKRAQAFFLDNLIWNVRKHHYYGKENVTD